ncbi:MAG: energy transducer TonB [Gammaproteobacteria bacterium]|nr:energy transducer TonB [Gammaproteobacteria bacterium]MDX5375264.1 energy transducer TonB [Gammaproteobacteria bacterium]
MLSAAVHVAAAGGYWLWGGQPAGHDRLPVVEVALLAEAVSPADPGPADIDPEIAPEPVRADAVPVTAASTDMPPVEHRPPERSSREPVAGRPPAASTAVPPASSASASAAPSPQPAAATAGLIASIEQAYKTALQAEIARHRSYPLMARRLRQEGTVAVGFVVQADGQLTAIELLESSGHRLLDEAALAAVREVARFRPIPEELDRQDWPLSVPLNFRLL